MIRYHIHMNQVSKLVFELVFLKISIFKCDNIILDYIYMNQISKITFKVFLNVIILF